MNNDFNNDYNNGQNQNDGNNQNQNNNNYYYNNQYQGYDYNRPPLNPNLMYRQSSGLAVGSLVLGILGILFACCCGMGAILGIIGLILAIVDRNRNGRFESIALGGLITSAVAIVFGVIMVVYLTVGIAELMNDPEFMSMYEELYGSMLEEGYYY